MVVVFNLRLCKGRNACGAPVDRLLVLVDVPGCQQLAENLDYARLIFRRHCFIGIIIIAENAQALELLHLYFNESLGVLPALPPYLNTWHLLGLVAKLTRNVKLNGQAVAVPSGDIGRPVAHHGVVLDNNVFEDLVQGVPQVQVAVGVGRAVMENVSLCPLSRLLDTAVYLFILPFFYNAGFLLREVCPHGEIGCRKIDCL